MKFSCTTADLAAGLSAVGHALSAKGSLPILANVLLSVEGSVLKLSATNLELYITTQIPARVEKEGRVCAPGRLLTDLVSTLPPTTVEIFEKENILTVETENVKSKLNGLAAAEFPKLTEGTAAEVFSLSPLEFSRSIPAVAFSAASDDGRPVLTGILLETQADSFFLVGVDGFRLSEKQLKLPDVPKTPLKIIVPARALAEIGRLTGSEEKLRVLLSEGENQVIFRTEKFEIGSRLIEGSFPDYRRIMPATFVAKATASTEEFRQAVKLASLFARDSSNVIKVSLRPAEGAVILSANTPEVGENETQFSARVEGETISVAFNSRYLSDCLGALTAPEIVFQASGQLTSGLFTPAGDSTYVHIIMPVRVQE